MYFFSYALLSVIFKVCFNWLLSPSVKGRVHLCINQPSVAARQDTFLDDTRHKSYIMSTAFPRKLCAYFSQGSTFLTHKHLKRPGFFFLLTIEQTSACLFFTRGSWTQRGARLRGAGSLTYLRKIKRGGLKVHTVRPLRAEPSRATPEQLERMTERRDVAEDESAASGLV